MVDNFEKTPLDYALQQSSGVLAKKLQDILEDIESDKLSLEQSIEKYKEGVELSKKCQKALDDAKQIIKVLDNEK